ncbi:MAG: class II fructose-bisphosphate aldolase, partial [Clostridia bacterium]|nr:class II fructose-bisphosphate aldolase [Clostridia bacterium]
MLVNMSSLLSDAERGGYAVGSFSVGNMEMVRAAVAAAEETDKPIIIQIAEKRLASSPLGLMGPMMVYAAKSAKVPVAVHLDHGLTRGCIREALELGFTSVMFDGSLLSFEENLAESSEICSEAHGYGATFEAELGVVGGNEG